jgi:hypothetical protein|tara:strand:- start:330 stop:938 length:609 start_codon:yes stop_codon:yes gene_type:complete
VSGHPRTLLICCGALAREIVALVKDNGWDDTMRVECLPAHLHNAPDRLPEAIQAKIRSGRARYDDVIVLYGDCGTGGMLDAVLEEEGVTRIDGAHCYEVYAGSGGFAALMEAEPGTFFLSDFLARHFDRLIIKGLGLDRFPGLRDTYFGNYKKLVYLAQTQDGELEDSARAAAARLGLAFEMRFTGYGGYQDFLAAHRSPPA